MRLAVGVCSVLLLLSTAACSKAGGSALAARAGTAPSPPSPSRVISSGPVSVQPTASPSADGTSTAPTIPATAGVPAPRRAQGHCGAGRTVVRGACRMAGLRPLPGAARGRRGPARPGQGPGGAVRPVRRRVPPAGRQRDGGHGHGAAGDGGQHLRHPDACVAAADAGRAARAARVRRRERRAGGPGDEAARSRDRRRVAPADGLVRHPHPALSPWSTPATSASSR